MNRTSSRFPGFRIFRRQTLPRLFAQWCVYLCPRLQWRGPRRHLTGFPKLTVPASITPDGRSRYQVPHPESSLMTTTRKVVLSWSSGKDSAWALHVLRQQGAPVVGLLTTTNSEFDRVAMHAVRSELLRAQADAVALPLIEVPLPHPCSNAEYESQMSAAVASLRDQGVTQIAFGDLYLEDIRRYREERLQPTGITPLFPLWGSDTRALAHEMITAGLRAHLTCVDPQQLDPSFAGRTYDASLLADLPPCVDPCGERGEFHTFAYAGPMFHSPITITPGPVLHRDGFCFADLLPPA